MGMPCAPVSKSSIQCQKLANIFTCRGSKLDSLSSLSSVPEETPLKNDTPSGRTVIVAIDARKESKNALDWALANQAKPGDIVYLLYVRPTTSNVRRRYSEGDGDSYLVCVEMMLDGLVKDARERFMIKCVPVIRSGCPRDQILDEVVVREADVLVMGIRPSGLFRRSVHKSVTEYCRKHAKCPVIVHRSS
eukprot:jgi/Mesen1/7761/ME000408S06869